MSSFPTPTGGVFRKKWFECMDYHAPPAVNYAKTVHNIFEIFAKGDRFVTARSKKTKKHRRLRRFLFLTPLLLMALAAAVGAAVLAPYASERMDMTLLSLPAVNRPAVLYARTPEDRAAREGDLVLAPHATLAPPEKRIYVPLSEMPDDLIHAFVAIEDKRFYRHTGVDPVRTARAVMGYLGHHDAGGGSTITQQLVKNLTGHDEPTPDRKLREIFLALDLERHADKNTVLECYLNIINLAEGCHGVGAAAMRYFSKSPADLTLPECATLAAITQNPARYDPITHPESVRGRRDVILRAMCDQGYIAETTLASALAAPLGLDPGTITETGDAGSVSSWYADMVAEDVIRDLCDRLGYTRRAAAELVYTGGLTVETAMDVELQTIVEDYYADLSHFPTGDDGRPQSAFILIDPHTGDILAVAGAIGEKTANRIQNYATDTRRPAGSCIKPLSLYAPAIEEGHITWATVLDDSPVTERNGQPWPRNADGLYRGRMTVAESLAESVNTVAVRLLETVGEDAALAYLRDRFGLTDLIPPSEQSLNDRTISSLALGQQTHGVTLRSLTAAYTAFPGGTVRPAVSYHRVLDRDGRVLLENPAGQGTSAISPETAALMTRLLETVTDHGTASRYITLSDTLGVSCAGKTGTTQNNCDRRFVGFTPRLTGGVWMGYDYPAELRGIAGNPCVRIWDDLLTLCEEVYRGAPPQEDFDLGTELIESEFCPLSGAIPNAFCDDPTHGTPTAWGWFIPGTEPRELCTLHEEPPVVTVPVDPQDPDRIPLLPEDILPAPDEAEETVPPEVLPWFSRWFRKFSRG